MINAAFVRVQGLATVPHVPESEHGLVGDPE